MQVLLETPSSLTRVPGESYSSTRQVLLEYPAGKPYLGGADPITELRAAKAALGGANASQELMLDSMAEDTQEVYEVKGKLLNLIEAQNRAAKRAFDGDAVTIGRFNSTIHGNPPDS